MSDTEIYNDGGMAFGSQVVTIGTANFIAEQISLDADSSIVETKNEVGIPNKQVLVPMNPTGSATLQLPDDETAPPERNSTFSLTPIGGGSAVTVIIKKVGQAWQQDGAQKVTVDIVKKLN